MLGIDTSRFRKSARTLQVVSSETNIDVHLQMVLRESAADLVIAANYIDDPTIVWNDLDIDELKTIAEKRGWSAGSLMFSYADGSFMCSSIQYGTIINRTYAASYGVSGEPSSRSKTPPDLRGWGKTPRDALLDAMKKAVTHGVH